MAEEPVLKEPPRSTIGTRAKAMAVVLSEEFRVPFRIFDAAAGRPLSAAEGETEATIELSFAPETIRELAQKGQNEVRWLGDGRYQLTLVFFENQQPSLVALGIIPELASHTALRQREQERLAKWLQAVADRIRLGKDLAAHRAVEQEQAAQAARAWKSLLGLDEAIRNTRIHKQVDRSRKQILQTAHQLLGSHTVMLLSEHAKEVVIQGDALLAPVDCRHLAELLTRSTTTAGSHDPVVWNEDKSALWTGRFPQINNLLAIAIPGTQAKGWLVALNKTAGRSELSPGGADSTRPVPFRKADAAVLIPFASLLNLQHRTAGRIEELRDLLVGLTRSLTAAIDAKDSYTYGHSERVARIAVELGRDLGLSADELNDIYLSGLLHDIGKIGIRDSVLTKAAPLTQEEYDHVKQHVTIGYNILAGLGPLHALLPGILYHHERYDGKGYPHGLSGEAIPFLARILAVADAYDAMSTCRPYRSSMSCAEVEKRLLDGKGTQWDARVIEAFERCRQQIHYIRQRGVGESLNRALAGILGQEDSSQGRALGATGKRDDTVRSLSASSRGPI
jgi:HD-GYP domain-containing protein (c-di-GMP phosphodiesterase class II)